MEIEDMERELAGPEWVCKPKDDDPITTEDCSERLKRQPGKWMPIST
jgi:hypothetical protein